ncbi:MAG: heterodisulfide reductase-related iron-sulfur binding cluster, partial [Phycisphaerae bacterium]|nr:heterodisulfide reductase-related iron-sulfur binding cluster [Phycisphaerae bacterium]
LCLKQELRHFVTGPDAELISGNVYELTAYLFDLLKQDKLKIPQKRIAAEFAYHKPCHLMVLDGDDFIELSKKLCDLDITDLNAGCCGLSGTFGMQKKNYELSEKISAGLRKALENSTADYILTECAACKMQIEHISDKKVIHPLKVIADAYKADG